MIKKRKSRIESPGKERFKNNDNSIKTYSINGSFNIIEIKNNNDNENILDDTEDIIENDEFVGEIPRNNYFYLKKDRNYDNNYIEEIIKGTKQSNYNNNYYHMSNQKNRIPKRRNEYGNVLEERRNYILYVSGIDNSNLDFQDSNNLKVNNERKIVKYYKENPSFELSKYKYYNSQNNTNENSYCGSSKNIITKNYSFYSTNRTNPHHICYSSPMKKIYKSPYNLKRKGIIKDNLYGKFYKVFQAVPVTIDEETDNKIRNRILSAEKNNYNYYNENFEINNINNNKNYVFQKPILRNVKTNNRNVINIVNNNNSKPKNGKKKKSLYIKEKNYSPNSKNNGFNYKKRIYYNNENNLKQKKIYNNNNNYVEINECNINKN